jgi:arylsulfatase A-like enzyme
VGFLKGLLLALLLATATDVTLTRWHQAHRAHDLLLPLQALLAWGLFALLVAWPARLTTRVLGAGLATCTAWLAGPVVLHHVLAARMRSRGGIHSTESWVIVMGALLGIAAAVLLLRAIELKLRRRRIAWPARLAAIVALLALAPHDADVLAIRPGTEHLPADDAAATGETGTGPATGTGGSVANAAAVAPTPDEGAIDGMPEDPARPPNLLLLVWDTTRADHLQPWGYDRATTPALAALAERATVWSSAWSASVFTLSSHTSMLTGLPPTLHGTIMSSQRVRAPTVAQALHAAGWRTGAFVGTSVLAAGRGLEDGFEVWDDRVDPPVCDTHLWSMVHDLQAALASRVPALRGNGLPHWFQDFERPADDVLDAAAAFIEADDGRPWFVMVNLFDTHWPYLPDAQSRATWVRPYAGPVGGYVFRADDFPPGHVPDASDKAHVRDLYDAEVWEVDRAVERFLARLDLERGGTAVLMTADHGEGLGERDTWSHEDLHGPQTHVPMLLFAPGRATAGARLDDPVSGIDVAPTLLDLAGLPLPETAMMGRSLLRTDHAGRLVFVQDHDSFNPRKIEDAVVRGRFKLLRKDGRTTLHDVESDPMDTVDLAERHPQVFRELQDALEELLELGTRQADVHDPELMRTLDALGYTGR